MNIKINLLLQEVNSEKLNQILVLIVRMINTINQIKNLKIKITKTVNKNLINLKITDLILII